MIVPMMKYNFLIFYKEYERFLKNLQELGLLHVVKKNVVFTDEIRKLLDDISLYDSVVHFLRNYQDAERVSEDAAPGTEILEDITQSKKEIKRLKDQLEELNKSYDKAALWGDFSNDIIQNLENEGIHLEFFKSSRKKYRKLEDRGFPVILIKELENQVIYTSICFMNETTDINFEAERIHLPEIPVSVLQERINETKHQITSIERKIKHYASHHYQALEVAKAKLVNKLKFETVKLNTGKEADDKLMLLEGWIPKPKVVDINLWLEQNDILYISEKGNPQDNIPILLKNNKFNKLFEPIGEMFSLPDYSELDLTVFFAPFFMMFFGFCLGDAGYGLLFLIGGAIYKRFAKPEYKPYISLIQYLGLATIVFGIISGTFFGINLIETDVSLISRFKELFFDPNKMFQLSLVLGGIQIIFGLFIKAANRIKQFGFQYGLSTYGWLIIVLGCIAYLSLLRINIIERNTTVLYAIFSLGGFLVLFFSDPESNIFTRLGKGIWDVYSTITGIFGDLLSYIRLFALGLSSAILGFVINDIGLQILDSSRIIGPLFFVIFLILGHTLNILISSLGSFVHPMRLTFVEFYKNAGFKGGGEAYKPFSKQC